MRMMGIDSVAYHEHTVAGRSDDPVAAAAAYYASRGETPMAWGGFGRRLLDLDGEVDLDDYRAVFGAGGAHDPRSGRRLVACRRPGIELVVSPHKSVAELGVIGRAEDMHRIVDAERDATLAYLDRLVAERGGRRGRAQTVTSTGGLMWATSRHATTRAGDPQVHDHVLIANAVAMGDERGGWKGLDTAFLRDHLHAATAVGRMAAAARAVELGYGIVADPGPSGRLGSWAIAGIPAQVCELHSTRSAHITGAVGADASYASRSVAARATREAKTEAPLEDLMARWQTELAAAGHPPADLAYAVTAAGRSYRQACPDPDRLAGELLGPGGRLAGEKTFTRGDVIVAVAPHLHGLPLSALDAAVDAVVAHHDAVRLPAVAGAREEVWSAACVLADEARIAGLAEILVADEGPKVPAEIATEAVAGLEGRLGGSLTDAQRAVAVGLMTGGHRLDVVVGVAGSGKTTTLAAVRAGFETAGYSVVGTATSGQAAKTLGDGAGMESRTMASLTWRLDHGTLALSDRHVLIVDEGAMTADVDLGRLLGAVERSGAKVVVVGDDRQLGAVGPGGALRALAGRHPGHLWALTDNLRQADPGERAALANLRDGQLAAAIAWCGHAGRVHPVTDRRRAVAAMVRSWAADTAAGRDTLMLAYRRDHVEALNVAARALFEEAGLLTGPELTAPGGRSYRAGDRVITLAPGPRGAWVTSQPAQVTAVDPERHCLTAVTPDGHTLHMGPDDIDADRLGYGYAVTAHRAQGATVDVAHVLADGGGRELAYVAMSRARTASHVYVPAGDLPSAVERLAWDWGQERRQEWISDQARAAQAVAAIRGERDRLLAAIPPDVSDRLARLREDQADLQRDLADLQNGAGRWADTPVGATHEALRHARWAHDDALRRAQESGRGVLARRRNRQSAEVSAATLGEADTARQQVIGSHARQLGALRAQLGAEKKELEAAERARAEYLAAHPEVVDRIRQLNQALTKQQARDRRQRLIGQPGLTPASRPDRLGGVATARQQPQRPQPVIPAGPEI
jgi:conjugative relaxase-like TrwC/TraI family protein